MPKLSKRTIDDLTPHRTREFVAWDSDLRGFGVRVKPSGRKTFVLQYRNAEGRSRRTTLGKHGVISVRVARGKALRLLADVTLGADPAEESQRQRKAMTLRELADLYLREHLQPKRNPSTVREFSRLLEKHILPSLGSRKVRRLMRVDIERFHADMTATPSQANRCIGVISAMIGFAERRELLPQGKNPCSLVEHHPERRRERFLSQEELSRLESTLDEVEGSGSEPRSAVLAIRLLALTGMRKGEVLNLTWDEVDFERACLHLADSKTGRERVPLAPAAVELLSHATRTYGNPYVCWGRRDGAALVGLQKIWERIRIAADLEGVRLHDLRHTFASFGAMEGIGLHLIGKVLGHAHSSTTERYAHLGPDPASMAASAIGQQVAAHLQRNGKEADE